MRYYGIDNALTSLKIKDGYYMIVYSEAECEYMPESMSQSFIYDSTANVGDFNDEISSLLIVGEY